MKLSRGPTENDLERCTTLLFNDESAAPSQMNDCILNPSYCIGKTFPFLESYQFLASETAMLNAAGGKETESDESDGDVPQRPIGNQSARRRRKIEKKGRVKRNRMEENAVEMASTVSRLERTLLDSHATAMARRQMVLQERRFEWETTRELFSPGSDASPEEKAELRAAMRKKVLKGL